MKNKIKTAQSGFTLVELIVVIIILAILGAVALPKFMDVTTKAQISAVKGAGGGLGAGVALFHAQWVANGHTAAQANVAGFGTDDIDANANGWPVSSSSDVTALSLVGHCGEVWNGVMQGPPTVQVGGSYANEDYVASVSGTTCTYTYHGGNATAPQPDGSNNMTITYASATGVVQVNNANE